MEDIEIDTADPVERCRRGREAFGVDEEPRSDDQAGDSREDSADSDANCSG